MPGTYCNSPTNDSVVAQTPSSPQMLGCWSNARSKESSSLMGLFKVVAKITFPASCFKIQALLMQVLSSGGIRRSATGSAGRGKQEADVAEGTLPGINESEGNVAPSPPHKICCSLPSKSAKTAFGSEQ